MASESNVKYSPDIILFAAENMLKMKTDMTKIEKAIPEALDTLNKISSLHQNLTNSIIPPLYKRAFNYIGKSNIALAKRLPDIMEDALNDGRLDLVATYFNFGRKHIFSNANDTDINLILWAKVESVFNKMLSKFDDEILRFSKPIDFFLGVTECLDESKNKEYATSSLPLKILAFQKKQHFSEIDIITFENNKSLFEITKAFRDQFLPDLGTFCEKFSQCFIADGGAIINHRNHYVMKSFQREISENVFSKLGPFLNTVSPSGFDTDRINVFYAFNETFSELFPDLAIIDKAVLCVKKAVKSHVWRYFRVVLDDLVCKLAESDADASDLNNGSIIKSLLKLKNYPKTMFSGLNPHFLKTLADEGTMESLKKAIIAAIGLISGGRLGNKSVFESRLVRLKRFKILVLVEGSLVEEIGGFLDKQQSSRIFAEAKGAITEMCIIHIKEWALSLSNKICDLIRRQSNRFDRNVSFENFDSFAIDGALELRSIIKNFLFEIENETQNVYKIPAEKYKTFRRNEYSFHFKSRDPSSNREMAVQRNLPSHVFNVWKLTLQIMPGELKDFENISHWLLKQVQILAAVVYKEFPGYLCPEDVNILERCLENLLFEISLKCGTKRESFLDPTRIAGVVRKCYCLTP